MDEDAVDEDAVDEDAVDEDAVDEDAVDEDAVDEDAVDEEREYADAQGVAEESMVALRTDAELVMAEVTAGGRDDGIVGEEQCIEFADEVRTRETGDSSATDPLTS